MIYKNYYFQIIIRICLIVLTSILTGIATQFNDKPYTIIVLSFLIFFQAYSLIRYNNKTNIELGKFFNALKDNDNTLTLQSESGSRSFRELTKALNETLSALKDARFEKEKQFRFLKFISEQVGIGLLVFDRENNIVLYNNAIAGSLGINQPLSINLIEKSFPGLPLFLDNLNHGENQLFKTSGPRRNILLVRSMHFSPESESLRLFIFQDLKNEMEDSEIETWHKMIRVLTHEIMNSVTPVINLTTASKNSLESIRNAISEERETIENLNDIMLNNEIIGERMKGLSDFIVRYKSASTIPIPEPGVIYISDLISGVINLLKKEIERKQAVVNIYIHQECQTIIGDKNLFEQALINLIKNSVEASENSEAKEINIECSPKAGKTVISVSDKGEGISKENMDRIFLPFFTTRENGSGIGLSLSRQIIRMHGGTLDVWSEQGIGTTVTITI